MPRPWKKALSEFRGAGRRLEYKGAYHDANVYDDYAHHPGALHALLEAVRSMGYRRVVCAFQTHTYSRTNAPEIVKIILFTRFEPIAVR